MSETPIISIVIIIITALTSFRAFGSPLLLNKLIFSPYLVKVDREYYRFLSSGFIHADTMHLLVNMYVLYIFGDIAEYFFVEHFGKLGKMFYVAMYILALAVSSLPAFIKHRNHSYYRALGASGATSAVVFSSILFAPWGEMGLLLIPWSIPSPIFGALYLLYSWYMGKRGDDNIGHDAHFWGAAFGFIFPILLKPTLFTDFITIIKMLLNGY